MHRGCDSTTDRAAPPRPSLGTAFHPGLPGTSPGVGGGIVTTAIGKHNPAMAASPQRGGAEARRRARVT